MGGCLDLQDSQGSLWRQMGLSEAPLLVLAPSDPACSYPS